MTDQDQTVEKPEDLALSYLSGAMEALFDCGRPNRLYPRPAGAPRTRKRLFSMMGASQRRLGFSRTSILFSALAAEAYTNLFIAEHLEGRELGALDRFPTPDKMMLGPKLVLGSALFDRGAEPMQSIAALFNFCRHLVHPRPRNLPVRKGQLFDYPGDIHYNLSTAARFLVAVSEAAATLFSVEGSSSTSSDRLAKVVVEDKTILLQYGKAAHTRLVSPPKRRVRRIERTAAEALSDEQPGTSNDRSD